MHFERCHTVRAVNFKPALSLDYELKMEELKLTTMFAAVVIG